MSNHLIFFSQLRSIVNLRIKIILRDKLTIILIIFTMLLFTFLISTLSIQAEQKSRIPIGVVDLDKSTISKHVINRMKKNNTLFIKQESFSKLKKELEADRIDSIYVIQKGFEQNIKKITDDHLIKVYNMEGKEDNEILSDIVTSDFIYDISLWKGVNLYLKYAQSDRNQEVNEYFELAGQINSTEEENFKFDIEYKQVDKNHKISKEYKNEFLYYQIIIVILGMLLALLEMFFTTNLLIEKEKGITNRFHIIPGFRRTFLVGNYIAVFLVNIILSAFFTVLINQTMKISKTINLIDIFQAILLYSCVVGGLFLVLAHYIRSITIFQILGSIFIFLNGITGFLSVADKLIHSQLLKIFKITPNSLFIQDFTDIIIYGNEHANKYDSNTVLLTINCIIIIILLVPFSYFLDRRKSITNI
ncbi:ABC transporter permease [Anaeromicropila herbilytica]|uniref:ABC-2 type transporter transmembrane domain-containing protein n=1 Tax=Anaeromicropila herbilytica TaxID=2785025 RepID=A0A7R7EKJ2_9FIRM|nr:ABC transporter permease [Anaeromicropila herbilytica]BCN30462.1 hypothetical protein bsdtb5_17570 [Anaeromicropila herbilytica]